MVVATKKTVFKPNFWMKNPDKGTIFATTSKKITLDQTTSVLPRAREP